MAVWYNENNEFAAQWLRNLMAEGLIAQGDIDTRSIVDVRAEDIRGYDRCHFFSGIGGWDIAMQIARWPADRPAWTASAPCQPYSAGSAVWKKGKAQQDERHLWPHIARLKKELRPATIFGEQVKKAIAFGWLDDVFHDLEEDGYACGATTLTSCAVEALDEGERIFFVAKTDGPRGTGLEPGRGFSSAGQGWPRSQEDLQSICDSPLQQGYTWPQPIIRSMDDGLLARTRSLLAYGNSINPYLAAAFIQAAM